MFEFSREKSIITDKYWQSAGAKQCDPRPEMCDTLANKSLLDCSNYNFWPRESRVNRIRLANARFCHAGAQPFI
jgi:hypothetical protein